MIKREITRHAAGGIRYVHVFCRSCPYWYSFTFTLERSYDETERHLINVHDIDSREAGTARRQHAYKTKEE